jgi:methylmalonyl-CoA/ethylmalonyl-CoA epimerase
MSDATRDDAVADRFGLGPIDQVAYVVRDMERALPHYTALFGPFRRAESPLRDCLYYGQPTDIHLRLAVNRSGPVEVELLEVVSGSTPLADHLEQHGEGLHHVRFRVANVDQTVKEMADAGFQTSFYKRFAPNLAFAYVEPPTGTGSGSIELLEMLGGD